MPLQDHLDQLAKRIALIDLSQGGQIVDLHSEIDRFKAQLPLDAPAGLLNELERALQATTKLLWAESTDIEGTGRILTEVITHIQDLLPALDSAASGQGNSGPQALAEPRAAALNPLVALEEEIDLELLGMFVESCMDSLSGIEQQVLGLAECCDPADSIAEIKRVMHTIKGECGVLSLEIAQGLCHLAEDMIIELPADAAFPEAAILALADWLVSYVNLLAADPRAGAPDRQRLEADLLKVRQSIRDGNYRKQAPMLDTPAGELSNEAAFPQQEAPVSDASNDFGLMPDAGSQRVTIDDETLGDAMLPEVVSEMRQHLELAEAAMLELGETDADAENINVIFRAFHTIKGIAGFMHMEAIVLVAHKAETMMDDFRKQLQAMTPKHTDLLFQSRDVIGTLLDALEGEQGPLLSSVNELTLSLSAATLGNDTGSNTPKQRPAEVATKAPTEPVGEAPRSSASNVLAPAPRLEAEAALRPSEELQSKAKAKAKIERTVKVATERLDVLIDMVGELVIAQQMVSQHPSILSIAGERLARDLSQVNKITRDLQESAMALRMVPLRSTFQKMTRLVRDVAIRSDKTVTLELRGEDTELDRNVVEEIGDPMIHLIRNAVDHGMESSAERRRLGKPAAGTLELSARHQGGSILIEIKDDGKGLDRQSIFNKSVERGLLPEDSRIEETSDSELWQKIFLPGFSTAASVTSLSGRGVGLDVVKRKIEGLRGKIEIESKQGIGTTFTLRLPLTLAIIDGMVIRIGSRRYVIPTLVIERSFQATRDQVSNIFGRGEVINVRGTSLPVMRIKDMLDLEEGLDDLYEGILLVVETNHGRVCLLVDEILGQQQIVIKSITKALPGTHGLSGAAILGDGVVALIIDTDSLVTDRIGELR